MLFPYGGELIRRKRLLLPAMRVEEPIALHQTAKLAAHKTGQERPRQTAAANGPLHQRPRHQVNILNPAVETRQAFPIVEGNFGGPVRRLQRADGRQAAQLAVGGVAGEAVVPPALHIEGGEVVAGLR